MQWQSSIYLSRYQTCIDSQFYQALAYKKELAIYGVRSAVKEGTTLYLLASAQDQNM